MARPLQVAVDCADPARLARFWADVLSYRLDDPPAGYPSWSAFSAAVGEAGEAWSALVDPDGVGPWMLFHQVAEGKVVKNRVHLDVRVSGAGRVPPDERRRLDDAAVRAETVGTQEDSAVSRPSTARSEPARCASTVEHLRRNGGAWSVLCAQ